MWAKITSESHTSNKLPWNIVKKVIQLPYLPEFINYTGCQALKKADGLYVPCGGKCDDASKCCAACNKSGAKFGMLDDRGAVNTYTDPSDKHEITFGTWLAKHEMGIEEIHAALEAEGFTLKIPDHCLTVNSKRIAAIRRPGRPGNAKPSVSDSGSENEDDEPKKTAKKNKSDDEKEPKPAKKNKSDDAKKVAKKSESDDEDLPKKTAKKSESDDEDLPKKAAKKSESGEKEAKKVAKKSKSESDDEKEEKKAAKKSESGEKEAKKVAKKSESDDEKEEKKAAKKDKSDEKAAKEEKKAAKEEKKAAKKDKEKKKHATKDDEEGVVNFKNVQVSSLDEAHPIETGLDTKVKKTDSKKTKTDDEEIAEETYEDEDEDIIYNGKNYILRNRSIVFNEDGDLVGVMENSIITFS